MKVGDQVIVKNVTRAVDAVISSIIKDHSTGELLYSVTYKIKGNAGWEQLYTQTFSASELRPA